MIHIIFRYIFEPQANTTLTLTLTLTLTVPLDLLNPKSMDVDSDYYCGKFQLILIKGFRTHTHTSRLTAVSASPYCVVSTDNNKRQKLKVYNDV